jgi:hypothetical protein
MKKNIIQIAILSILLLVVVLAQFVPVGNSRIMDLLKIGNKGTIKELRDFNIEDTSRVDRIFLVDKENRTVDLVRSKRNKWIVNNDYVANKYNVDLILTTLKKMRIKSPVARSAEENIIKQLATKSVKVEVYDGDEIMKVVYIGGVTQNQTGTYAILEGSSRPFIIEIPGFRGYLSSRFHTFENFWRSQKIFQYDETEIKKISVQVASNPAQSFSIQVNGIGDFQLFDSNDREAQEFDTLSVRRFVKEFKNKAFSEIQPNRFQGKVDSIYNSSFFYRFNVELNEGNNINLSLHKIEGFKSEDIYDIEAMNAVLNQKLWVYIQTHLFVAMFRELDDFKPVF